jgi:hypothetical protein
MSLALLLWFSRHLGRHIATWRRGRQPASLAGPFLIYRPLELEPELRG